MPRAATAALPVAPPTVGPIVAARPARAGPAAAPTRPGTGPRTGRGPRRRRDAQAEIAEQFGHVQLHPFGDGMDELQAQGRVRHQGDHRPEEGKGLGPVLGRLYLAFFRQVLPRVGQALAPNSEGAYRYLPASVLQFPDGRAMLDLLASRGLIDTAMHPLTFGIATLYVGVKPGGGVGG